MPFSLESLRDCFDGGIPAVLATSALDGIPNIAYLSQVQYIDYRHIALTFQFFNKTHANIQANPYATLCVTHPDTAASHRLALRYLRTETAGPLFEMMRAKLSGIAAHTGMADIFRLLGADVYEVLDIEALPGGSVQAKNTKPNLLPLLRQSAFRLNACLDLDTLFNALMAVIHDNFGIHHAMMLMHDNTRHCLYTVASLGYGAAGIGSEIPLGYGVIGIAGREQTPIRIAHSTSEYGYGKAIRASMEQIGLTRQLETAIPMPGIADCRSQMAAPVVYDGQLLGVVYVESDQDLRFGYDEEDALMILSAHLATAIKRLLDAAELVADDMTATFAPPPAVAGDPIHIRHFQHDHSLFIDDTYLIKGVAGAIFWHLAQQHQQGRTHFSNRELRLLPEIGLPELSDNLEARLVLLKRRLDERQCGIRIKQAGRGRFCLDIAQPLTLDTVSK
jgi:adenylate cyclase